MMLKQPYNSHIFTLEPVEHRKRQAFMLKTHRDRIHFAGERFV